MDKQTDANHTDDKSHPRSPESPSSTSLKVGGRVDRPLDSKIPERHCDEQPPQVPQRWTLIEKCHVAIIVMMFIQAGIYFVTFLEVKRSALATLVAANSAAKQVTDSAKDATLRRRPWVSLVSEPQM